MKIKRLAASMTVAVTAVTGLSVGYAGPAAAAAGTWRSYAVSPPNVGNSTWHCGRSTPIETGVSAQACVVRSSSGLDVQAAVIVRNVRTSLYGAEAAIELDRGAGTNRWECRRSGVGKDSWSVCFGQTFVENLQVQVLNAGVNGVEVSVIGANG